MKFVMILDEKVRRRIAIDVSKGFVYGKNDEIEWKLNFLDYQYVNEDDYSQIANQILEGCVESGTPLRWELRVKQNS